MNIEKSLWLQAEKLNIFHDALGVDEDISLNDVLLCQSTGVASVDDSSQGLDQQRFNFFEGKLEHMLLFDLYFQVFEILSDLDCEVNQRVDPSIDVPVDQLLLKLWLDVKAQDIN